MSDLDSSLSGPLSQTIDPEVLVGHLLKVGHQLTLRHVSLMQSKLRTKVAPLSAVYSPDLTFTEERVCTVLRREGSRGGTPVRRRKYSSPGSFVRKMKAAILEAERCEGSLTVAKPHSTASVRTRQPPPSLDYFLTRKAVKSIAAPLSKRVIPQRFAHCRRRISASRLTLEEVLCQQRLRNSATGDR